MSCDVGPGPDLAERQPFDAADAECLLGVEAVIGGDWAFDADDWYAALAALMAERAPA